MIRPMGSLLRFVRRLFAILGIDTPKPDLIGRMHGRGWHARTTDRFEMPRISLAGWQNRSSAE